VSKAQLSGLFGENAAALSSVALDKGVLELEPTYSYMYANGAWEGKTLTPLSDLESSASVTWRITYGLGDDWEIGFGAPTNLRSLGFAVKRALLVKDVFALGAAVGITEPTTEAPQDIAKSAEFRTSYGLALLGYWNLDQSSFDINVQYQNYFNPSPTNAPPAFFINADWGQWIIPGKVRAMLGVGYQTSNDQRITSSLWSMYPALQIDFPEHFSLVLNTQHDFSGKNAPKSTGLNVTLTTIW